MVQIGGLIFAGATAAAVAGIAISMGSKSAFLDTLVLGGI